MKPSLANITKYFIYGIIISLLINIVPNKRLAMKENYMVVFIAVGSFILLDVMCPNKKTVEKLANTYLPPNDLNLKVYNLNETNSNKTNNKIHDNSDNGSDDDTVEKDMHPEELVDEQLEEELGCDCKDEIKKITNVFKKEMENIKNSYSNKINKYKKKYKIEVDKNIFEDIQFQTDDETLEYDNNTLNQNAKNEWNTSLKTAKKLLGINNNIRDLNRINKIKLLKKSSELMIRKEIMKTLGVVNTPYSHLDKKLRSKIDRMTNIVLELEDNIITQLHPDYIKSGKKNIIINKKNEIENNNNTQIKIDEETEDHIESDYDEDNKEEWNDMGYSELNPNLLLPLGSYNKNFTNKWNKGWTDKGEYIYLDTDKWKIPQTRPPVCVTNTPSNVHPNNTNGYPVNLMNWNDSRKVMNGSNINTKYIKNKLNKKLKKGKKVYDSN